MFAGQQAGLVAVGRARCWSVGSRMSLWAGWLHGRLGASGCTDFVWRRADHDASYPGGVHGPARLPTRRGRPRGRPVRTTL